MNAITLKVDGMHCSNCSASINNTLNALPGVKAAADHVTGQVLLELDGQTDLETVRTAIEDLGFDLV